MAVSELVTLQTAAVSAVAAGDYATAIQKALAAIVILGTTPNVQRSLAGGGSQSVTWNDATAIERFIAQCERARAAAAIASGGLFRQSKLNYSRAAAADDYS